MFFLLRVAFWLTIVLALLPSGSSAPTTSSPGATETVAAASAAVSDVSHFCERQAEACVVGSQAAVLIGQRAQAGAKLVYDFIQERMTRSETGPIPQRRTAPGHSPRPQTPPQFAGSQSTLQPSDLAPTWQGPAPRIEMVPLPRPRRAIDARRVASNS